MTEREEALEPCPFCGVVPEPPFQNLMDDDDGNTVSVFTMAHQCKQLGNTLWASAPELSGVVSAWNLRASSPPPKGGGWRPMKTAPKDGTRVLVDFGPCGVHAVAWEETVAGTTIWAVDDRKHGPYPLRGYVEKDERGWMPLPAAPDGKATPPDEMGAEQPKAASEHLLTENARLREALEAAERIVSGWQRSLSQSGYWEEGDPLRVARALLSRAALSERTE